MHNFAATVRAYVTGHLNGSSYRIFGGEKVQRPQSLEARVLSPGGFTGRRKHTQTKRRMQRRHLRTVQQHGVLAFDAAHSGSGG